MTDPTELLSWGDWRPLARASRDPAIPRTPGLYRIRRAGRGDIDYIGQTGKGGMALRSRLGMLRGVFAEDMPYRDPHTAGPALWALRQETGEDFEVSVVSVEGSTPWRKGLEALAIALYRQDYGRSPTVEFGRMPAGYRPSSMKGDRRLREAGRVVRGGRSDELDVRHLPGLPPVAPLTGDPLAEDWGGHAWTPWSTLTHRAGPSQRGSGLYRIRGRMAGLLMYIGQGKIPYRPLAHLAKTRDPDHEQGQLLAAAAPLEWSWVIDDNWLPHQRLELENDLIAAHLLNTGDIPVVQFRG